jgi:hypothetical protein
MSKIKIKVSTSYLISLHRIFIFVRFDSALVSFAFQKFYAKELKIGVKYEFTHLLKLHGIQHDHKSHFSIKNHGIQYVCMSIQTIWSIFRK